MVAVKICGLTRVEDAVACVQLGVDALGVNFWPQSKRFCVEEAALSIAKAVKGQTLLVGVFVDATPNEMQRIQEKVGLDCVQLHGTESPQVLEQFLPHAYKCIRVENAESLAAANHYAGDYLMVDAFVADVPGGTGQTLDWHLVQPLCAQRKVLLAGGLTPDNVADAILQARPFGVDVASGVESAPGQKNLDLVKRFVEQAKAL